ncbi:MAG TPA: ASCH domain-containing protein [Anaerolineae bacterium]|nr:ASCH domain-containing protein [Anaerolineae bacterium]
MLALSIKQPWAMLIVGGQKSIEVRKWKGCPRHAIGQEIAIHAGRKIDDSAPQEVRKRAFQVSGAWQGQTGGIIGRATLVDVLRFTMSSFEDLYEDHLNPPAWFEHGLIGLQFISPVRFPEMIPYRGQLGFFDVPDGMMESGGKS